MTGSRVLRQVRLRPTETSLMAAPLPEDTLPGVCCTKAGRVHPIPSHPPPPSRNTSPSYLPYLPATPAKHGSAYRTRAQATVDGLYSAERRPPRQRHGVIFSPSVEGLPTRLREVQIRGSNLLQAALPLGNRPTARRGHRNWEIHYDPQGITGISE